MNRLAFLLILPLLVASGCSGSNPASPTVTGTLVIQDIVVGTGTAAAVGDTLTVTYTLSLGDGTVIPQPSTPYSFVLGAGTVIPGWDQGLVGMRVGGERKLTVPPNLGYGNKANGPIPANSTLIFDIHLLSVNGGA